jgi:hypothetical protein
MSLPPTKLENFALLTITMTLPLSPLYLLFLVRLGWYIVNLWSFYFTSSSGNWPFFLQLQDFSLRHITVASSTTTVRCSPHNSNLRLGYSLWGCSTADYFEYRRRPCVVQITHSPITLVNLSSINFVSIFRCSSPPHNPVYVSRVDPSPLVSSLSSHRHSYSRFL